jgi:hypothetical protein
MILITEAYEMAWTIELAVIISAAVVHMPLRQDITSMMERKGKGTAQIGKVGQRTRGSPRNPKSGVDYTEAAVEHKVLTAHI